ncbi:MAG: RnfABCDGE type electron transport complex subunit D [Clostridia bacterium]|nr:RnfABCDGE type electron transport complex subunit D [Clostridia bacterium]
MNDLSKLKVSSSPHIRAEDTTAKIMLDVLIALLPALAIGAFVYGGRALTLTIISALGCMFFEWIYELLAHKPITIDDGSAAVTGVLLAFVLPVSTPMLVVLLGDLFAIVVVKQLFGGIGKNFVNPALASRGFLLASFAGLVGVTPKIRTTLPLFTNPVDVVTTATPLTQMKSGVLPDISVMQNALGMVGGTIGEISTFALLAGFAYLVFRKVISPRIPLTYMGTVAVLAFLFPQGNPSMEWMLCQLVSGGLVLAAVFMATDYVTSPITIKGQYVYAVGCGIITIVIRYFGTYPEGVSYAILVMNLFVPLIEKYTMPRKFGAPPKEKKLKKAEGGAANEK